jgi:cation transporter-like permease
VQVLEDFAILIDELVPPTLIRENMTDQDASILDAKVQVLLAEYSSLRQEIQRRTRYQLYSVTASIIAVGGLLSIISAEPDKFAVFLIIIPWVLSVFGIIWLDHSHGIHLIGLYIREEIEGKLPRLLSPGEPESSPIGWETYLHKRRGESRLLGYIDILLPAIYFLLPSLASFGAYGLLAFTDVSRPPPVLEWSLVGMGLILVFALMFSWYRAQRMYESTRLNDSLESSEGAGGHDHSPNSGG